MALLAHVDAGKTTLSESILFNTGAIRKAGRVDHRDSFLDTEAQERERGITIFSKQALFNIGGNSYTLIDTPGHTDFSAETERVLSVLDFAVLMISAPDGIHGHDLTLWRLLKTYKVPTLIFVNKLDQPGADAAAVLRELENRFGSGCVDFAAFNTGAHELQTALSDAAGMTFKGKNIHGNASSATTHTGAYFSFADSYEREAFFEAIAELDEAAMEHYFEDGEISQAEIIRLFKERKLYPVLFGSALKNEGVDKLLTLIDYLCADAECIQHLSGEGTGTAADNVKAGSPGLASDINESDAAKAAVSTNQGTETFAAKITGLEVSRYRESMKAFSSSSSVS